MISGASVVIKGMKPPCLFVERPPPPSPVRPSACSTQTRRTQNSFKIAHRRTHPIVGRQSLHAEDARAFASGVLVNETTEVARVRRRASRRASRWRGRISFGTVDRHAPRTPAFFSQASRAGHVAGGRSVPVVAGGIFCWVPAPTLEKLRQAAAE